MNRKETFIKFMESMKTESNAMLMEAIKAGFNATSLFEGFDTIEIGSSPYSEDCAQVGSDNYSERARKELVAYKNQLVRMFGEPPEGARLFIKSNPHDFGTYHELACKYNEDNEEAAHYAYKLEGEGPEFWDAEAKRELGIDAGLTEASAGEDWNNSDEDTIPSNYTDEESVGEVTRHYQMTYDVTTDESAEHGDYAEAGWADAHGNRFANDPETGVQEAPEAEEISAEPEYIVDEMVRVLRNSGANENNGDGTAYRTSDADINYNSGEHTYTTYHLIDFTPEEIEAIELKMKGR